MANKNVIRPASHAVGNFMGQAAEQLGYGTKKKDIEISEPMHFEHRAHVGFQPGEGLQSTSSVPFEDLDPTIQQVLRLIGETPSNFTAQDREFIYDVVDQHGGIEQLREELGRAPKPARSPSSVASKNSPGKIFLPLSILYGYQ